MVMPYSLLETLKTLGCSCCRRHLSFFNGVDDEHVLQILHGSFHPVVERSRSLRKLQEQLINSLQQLLRPLKAVEKNKNTLLHCY